MPIDPSSVSNNVNIKYDLGLQPHLAANRVLDYYHPPLSEFLEQYCEVTYALRKWKQTHSTRRARPRTY